MRAISPIKILTEEDCELRIKRALEELAIVDSFTTDQLRLEADISIWKYVRDAILEGNIVTFDATETFGYWPKQT